MGATVPRPRARLQAAPARSGPGTAPSAPRVAAEPILEPAQLHALDVAERGPHRLVRAPRRRSGATRRWLAARARRARAVRAGGRRRGRGFARRRRERRGCTGWSRRGGCWHGVPPGGTSPH